jgi:TPR repeat protein
MEPNSDSQETRADKPVLPENLDEELRERIEAEDPKALAWMGWCYLNGMGVEKDDAQGVAWLQRAADKGSPEALLELANSYRAGRFTETDFLQAFESFCRRSKAGDALATVTIAQLYALGVGVCANEREALRWYRLAADKGDVYAMIELGARYLGAQGVEQDDAQARAWFEKAAQQGSFEAEDMLQWMRQSGRIPASAEEKAGYARKALTKRLHWRSAQALASMKDQHDFRRGVSSEEFRRQWLRSYCQRIPEKLEQLSKLLLLEAPMEVLEPEAQALEMRVEQLQTALREYKWKLEREQAGR